MNPAQTAQNSAHDGRSRPWLKVYDELGLVAPSFDDRTFAQHIEEHARVRPGSVALRCFDRDITYREYYELACRMANALVSLGVLKGDVVAFMMPNLPQAPVTIAAISMLGAIGTGVSQLLAPVEVAFQLSNSNARVLVIARPLLEALRRIERLPQGLRAIIVTGPADHYDPKHFAASDIAGVRVLRYLDLIASVAPHFEQQQIDPHDIFMVQYTGGTTGMPKGAQLSVRTLMHNVIMANAPDGAWDVGNEVVVCAFPMFHIAGLSWLLLAARLGATYIVVPDPREVTLLVEQMRRFSPTRLGAVPALFEMLLRCEGFEKIDFSRLVSAKTGAAPMSPETARALEAVIGTGKISEVFGMTETGPCYTCHPPARYKRGSVGFPAPGADVRIRDAKTGAADVPAGEPGEICCSGPQLMRGYLNLPDETAHALREIDGRLWMFSGDIGYMDEEGYLFLCDRAKDMLIVGGFKVFSLEIEHKLAALACVERCAIVGEPDLARPGNDIVTLFVQVRDRRPDRGAEDIQHEILEFCRDSMAPYKVPKQIHIVDAIPLTGIGKIDKKALRERLRQAEGR